MSGVKYDERYILSSLNNALKILEVLMVRNSMSLNEITKTLGLNKTSVYKMLYTLEFRGFIVRVGTAKYKLSPRLRAADSSPQEILLDAAPSCLMKLWAATGLSTILGVLSPSGKVVILLLKLGKDQTTVSGRIGAEMDWYSTACGTVLLSHAAEETKQSIISSTLYKRFTEKTIIEPEKLRLRLEECREQKVFLVDGENHTNHCDIASPIWDRTGNCIASIACIYEKSSDSPDLEYVKAAVVSAAEAISAQLGYSSGTPTVDAR